MAQFTIPSTSSHLAPPDLLVSSIQELQAHSKDAGERHREALDHGRRVPVSGTTMFPAIATELGTRRSVRRKKRRGRRVPWNKLLWVRQSYPDNYTDASTFLDHLQRNPRLQPYEFWRLVADSTVIIQHVCSVAIFVCCFTGIFQERVSPITVVSWGSAGTVLGWIIWDFWVGNDHDLANIHNGGYNSDEDGGLSGASFTTEPGTSSGTRTPRGGLVDGLQDDFHPPPQQWQGDPLSSLSPRNQQRLATMKSAALIYCAVLGLSPILKSLTKSTTSDSIWAMSCWLMGINVFFFDYGGGVSAKFPASLSTNAALMASTVLASRLTSTTHVFSLTIFSIEVFGLFPVFRRHLVHVSRTLHNILTLALMLGAGGSVAITVGGGSWSMAVLGCSLGLMTTALAMGGASWWLIGLQKWKDEIVGPWDAARPRLRRRWA